MSTGFTIDGNGYAAPDDAPYEASNDASLLESDLNGQEAVTPQGYFNATPEYKPEPVNPVDVWGSDSPDETIVDIPRRAVNHNGTGFDTAGLVDRYGDSLSWDSLYTQRQNADAYIKGLSELDRLELRGAINMDSTAIDNWFAPDTQGDHGLTAADFNKALPYPDLDSMDGFSYARYLGLDSTSPEMDSVINGFNAAKSEGGAGWENIKQGFYGALDTERGEIAGDMFKRLTGGQSAALGKFKRALRGDGFVIDTGKYIARTLGNVPGAALDAAESAVNWTLDLGAYVLADQSKRLGGIVRGVADAIEDVPTLAYTGITNGSEQVASALENEVSDFFTNQSDTLEAYRRSVLQSDEQAFANPNVETGARGTLNTVIDAVGTSVPYLFPYFGQVAMAGDSVNEIEKNLPQNMTRGQRLLLTAIGGAAYMGIERLTMGKIKGDLANAFAPGRPFGRYLADTGLSIGEQGLQEGAQNILTQTFGMLGNTLAGNDVRDMDWGAVGTDALLGAAVGGVFAAPGLGVQGQAAIRTRRANLQSAARVEMGVKAVEEAFAAAKDAAGREAAELQVDYTIARAQAEGTNQPLYVPAARVAAMAEKAKAEFSRAVRIDVSSIDSMGKAGADLVVDAGTLAKASALANSVSEVHPDIHKFASVERRGLNFQEAVNLSATDARQAFADRAIIDRIKESPAFLRIVDRYREAGVMEVENDIEGMARTLVGAVRGIGKDPETYLSTVNLNILLSQDTETSLGSALTNMSNQILYNDAYNTLNGARAINRFPEDSEAVAALAEDATIAEIRAGMEAFGAPDSTYLLRALALDAWQEATGGRVPPTPTFIRNFLLDGNNDLGGRNVLYSIVAYYTPPNRPTPPDVNVDGVTREEWAAGRRNDGEAIRNADDPFHTPAVMTPDSTDETVDEEITEATPEPVAETTAQADTAADEMAELPVLSGASQYTSTELPDSLKNWKVGALAEELAFMLDVHPDLFNNFVVLYTPQLAGTWAGRGTFSPTAGYVTASSPETVLEGFMERTAYLVYRNLTGINHDTMDDVYNALDVDPFRGIPNTTPGQRVLESAVDRWLGKQSYASVSAVINEMEETTSEAATEGAITEEAQALVSTETNEASVETPAPVEETVEPAAVVAETPAQADTAAGIDADVPDASSLLAVYLTERQRAEEFAPEMEAATAFINGFSRDTGLRPTLVVPRTRNKGVLDYRPDTRKRIVTPGKSSFPSPSDLLDVLRLRAAFNLQELMYGNRAMQTVTDLKKHIIKKNNFRSDSKLTDAEVYKYTLPEWVEFVRRQPGKLPKLAEYFIEPKTVGTPLSVHVDELVARHINEIDMVVMGDPGVAKAVSTFTRQFVRDTGFKPEVLIPETRAERVLRYRPGLKNYRVNANEASFNDPSQIVDMLRLWAAFILYKRISPKNHPLNMTELRRKTEGINTNKKMSPEEMYNRAVSDFKMSVVSHEKNPHFGDLYGDDRSQTLYQKKSGYSTVSRQDVLVDFIHRYAPATKPGLLNNPEKRGFNARVMRNAEYVLGDFYKATGGRMPNALDIKQVGERVTGASFDPRRGFTYSAPTDLPNAMMLALAQRLAVSMGDASLRKEIEAARLGDAGGLLGMYARVIKQWENLGAQAKSKALYQLDDNDTLGLFYDEYTRDGESLESHTPSITFYTRANGMSYNAYTLSHEWNHFVMERVVYRENPDLYRRMVTAFGGSFTETGRATPESLEKVARGVERYLATGDISADGMVEYMEYYRTQAAAAKVRTYRKLKPAQQAVLDGFYASQSEVKYRRATMGISPLAKSINRLSQSKAASAEGKAKGKATLKGQAAKDAERSRVVENFHGVVAARLDKHLKENPDAWANNDSNSLLIDKLITDGVIDGDAFFKPNTPLDAAIRDKAALDAALEEGEMSQEAFNKFRARPDTSALKAIYAQNARAAIQAEAEKEFLRDPVTAEALSEALAHEENLNMLKPIAKMLSDVYKHQNLIGNLGDDGEAGLVAVNAAIELINNPEALAERAREFINSIGYAAAIDTPALQTQFTALAGDINEAIQSFDGSPEQAVQIAGMIEQAAITNEAMAQAADLTDAGNFFNSMANALTGYNPTAQSAIATLQSWFMLAPTTWTHNPWLPTRPATQQDVVNAVNQLPPEVRETIDPIIAAGVRTIREQPGRAGRRQTWRALSPGTILSLKDALEKIDSWGRPSENTFAAAPEHRVTSAMASALAEQAANSKIKLPSNAGTRLLRFINSWAVLTEHTVDRLDGYKLRDTGKPGVWVQTFRAARDLFNRATAYAGEELQANTLILEELHRTLGQEGTADALNADPELALPRLISDRTWKSAWTDDIAGVVIMHWGNAHGRASLRELGITDAMIATIASKMTPASVASMNKVYAQMGRLVKQADTNLAAPGVHPDALTIRTAGGLLTGGWIPMNGANDTSPSVSYETADYGSADTLTFDFTGLQNSVKGLAMAAVYGTERKTIRDLIHDNGVIKSLDATLGHGVRDKITEKFDEILGKRPPVNPILRGLSGISSMQALHALGLNLWTAAKQSLDIIAALRTHARRCNISIFELAFRYMVEVGDVMRASPYSTKLYGVNRDGTYTRDRLTVDERDVPEALRLIAQDPAARNRQNVRRMQSDAQIKNILSHGGIRGRLDSAWQTMNAIGFFSIEYADMHLAVPMYNTVYKTIMERTDEEFANMSITEKEAFARENAADSLRTFSSNATPDINAIQSNQFGRSVTMFMSPVFRRYSRIVEAINAVQDGHDSGFDLAYSLAVELYAPEMLRYTARVALYAARGAMGLDVDDEEEEFDYIMDHPILAFLSPALQGVPYGSNVQFLMKTGGNYGGLIQIGPVDYINRTFADSVRAGTNIYKGKTAKGLWSAAKIVPAIAGVNVNRLEKMYNSARDDYDALTR